MPNSRRSGVRSVSRRLPWRHLESGSPIAASHRSRRCLSASRSLWEPSSALPGPRRYPLPQCGRHQRCTSSSRRPNRWSCASTKAPPFMSTGSVRSKWTSRAAPPGWRDSLARFRMHHVRRTLDAHRRPRVHMSRRSRPRAQMGSRSCERRRCDVGRRCALPGCGGRCRLASECDSASRHPQLLRGRSRRHDGWVLPFGSRSSNTVQPNQLAGRHCDRDPCRLRVRRRIPALDRAATPSPQSASPALR